MALEAVALEHLPASLAVYVALFRDVDNAAFLHQQLLSRNADFEYAFVDASVVLSRRQLLSAVFKAALALVNAGLRTPNVHSEIVTALSPSNNIAEAYRRFGVSPSTRHLLVVKVTSAAAGPGPTPPSGHDLWQHLHTNIHGHALGVTDENISAATDLAKVRKYYKLNGLRWLDALEDDRDRHAQMEMLVLGAMALRGL